MSTAAISNLVMNPPPGFPAVKTERVKKEISRPVTPESPVFSDEEPEVMIIGVVPSVSNRYEALANNPEEASSSFPVPVPIVTTTTTTAPPTPTKPTTTTAPVARAPIAVTPSMQHPIPSSAVEVPSAIDAPSSADEATMPALEERGARRKDRFVIAPSSRAIMSNQENRGRVRPFDSDGESIASLETVVDTERVTLRRRHDPPADVYDIHMFRNATQRDLLITMMVAKEARQPMVIPDRFPVVKLKWPKVKDLHFQPRVGKFGVISIMNKPVPTVAFDQVIIKDILSRLDAIPYNSVDIAQYLRNWEAPNAVELAYSSSLMGKDLDQPRDFAVDNEIKPHQAVMIISALLREHAASELGREQAHQVMETTLDFVMDDMIVSRSGMRQGLREIEIELEKVHQDLGHLDIRDTAQKVQLEKLKDEYENNMFQNGRDKAAVDGRIYGPKGGYARSHFPGGPEMGASPRFDGPRRPPPPAGGANWRPVPPPRASIRGAVGARPSGHQGPQQGKFHHSVSHALNRVRLEKQKAFRLEFLDNARHISTADIMANLKARLQNIKTAVEDIGENLDRQFRLMKKMVDNAKGHGFLGIRQLRRYLDDYKSVAAMHPCHGHDDFKTGDKDIARARDMKNQKCPNECRRRRSSSASSSSSD